MSEEKILKPTLFEELCIRTLIPRKYSDPKELAEYDWKKLMAWKETPNCFMAVEAIVSNALHSASPHYINACQWIEQNKDNKLIQAAAIRYASFSKEMRGHVFEEIIDKYDIGLSPKLKQLWKKSRDSVLSIYDITANMDKMDKFIVPKENTPEFYRTIKRLIYPSPKEIIPKIAKSYIDLFYHEEHPALADAMVKIALNSESDGLFNTIMSSKQFYKFFEGLLSRLASNHEHSVVCRERLKEFAKWLPNTLEHWLDYRKTELQKVLSKLFQKPNSLICGIGAELIGLIREEFVWDDVPKFLKAWELKRERSDKSDGYLKALRLLPIRTKAEYLKLQKSSILLEEFQVDIVNNPDIFIDALSDEIGSGGVSIEFMLKFLSRIRETDKIKDLFTKWLENYCYTKESDHSDYDSVVWNDIWDLITNYIQPGGFPIGRILTNYPKTLLYRGYQLQSVDIKNETTIKRILQIPDDHIPGKKALPSLPKIWDNLVWREALIKCGICQDLVLESLLTTEAQKYNVDSHKIIYELLFRDAGLMVIDLWDKLVALGWENIRHFGHDCYRMQRLARKMTTYIYFWHNTDISASLGYFRRKIKEMPLYFSTDVLYDYERDSIEKFFDDKEQTNMFFNLALRNVEYDSKSKLPDPRQFEHLFKSAQIDNSQNKKRLRIWLEKNYHKIQVEHWLKWIEHYNIEHEKTVKKRLSEILDIGHKDDILHALKLLEKSKTN